MRYKRLILCDSFLANEIAGNLEHFRQAGFFPDLVAQYEQELWLEFVEGEKVRSVNESLVQNIAEFYATVYGKNPIFLDTEDTQFVERLLRDLRFLHSIGVLTQDAFQDIQAVVPELTPTHVWVGYDYTDPVLKNFIVRSDNGRLCVIDVDGIAGNQLLGMGVAKACFRWIGPHRSLFFSSLAQHGAPDIGQYFSFVELCFLGKWTKRAFLEHDWNVIDAALFERFRKVK